MASLAELAAATTTLSSRQVQHLTRLVAAWSLLCDLASADLLLYAPTGEAAGEFVVLGHVRPTTGLTSYRLDPVGEIVSPITRPVLGRCWRDGIRREVPVPRAIPDADADRQRLLVEFIPVRVDGEVAAVVTRERALGLGEARSGLETEYRALWRRFATMIEQGVFPPAVREQVGEFREPRVGDGVVVLDREQRVVFASPNALSGLHRLGVRVDLAQRTLSDIGIDDTVVRRALASRHSTIAELVHGAELSVVIRCYPLLEEGRSNGAVALLRDVSELRSRDRLLVSKDATIREIHHRVKNNLQTIQSLLRLQARRLKSDEAKNAVEQSARRIGAIAIVHETLSTDATDVVDFDSVVAQVVRLVEEGLTSPERPLRVDVDGRVGDLPGDIAMPLAVALAELVQNALDHASGFTDADVEITMSADRGEVRLRVVNGGAGVPDGFSLDRDGGLGLTIVRTFVVSDLGGTMTIGPARAELPRGVVVEIRVPRHGDGRALG